MTGALESLRPALASICSRLGLAPSEAQTGALLAYLALLLRWNGTYNLTAVREPDRMLTQHLADCLAIVRPLQAHLQRVDRPRLLDVGSGGGLPGAVIAVLLPTIDVTCVDTVGKKAAFVQQVAASLKLPNLHSVHARVEQLREPSFDVVTSRAFASLSDFTRLTDASLRAAGHWLAMKGKLPSAEIEALPPQVGVFHVEQLTVPDLDADRCLVWLRRTSDAEKSPAVPSL
jgi:16S rRNA (guanine527-N7)-methyltransferase